MLKDNCYTLRKMFHCKIRSAYFLFPVRLITKNLAEFSIKQIFSLIIVYCDFFSSSVYRYSILIQCGLYFLKGAGESINRGYRDKQNLNRVI